MASVLGDLEIGKLGMCPFSRTLRLPSTMQRERKKYGYIVMSVLRALLSSLILRAFVCVPTVRLLDGISVADNLKPVPSQDY